MEVVARRVVDFYHCKETGDFFLTPPNPHDNGNKRLSFICPCGCGMLCGIRIRDDGQQIHGAWGWDGNEEQPTVTPSIDINSGHWHGYLTNGIFRSC